MTGFSSLMRILFGWLPAELYIPIMGIVAIAFLIIMVRILIALVEIISKVVLLFLGG